VNKFNILTTALCLGMASSPLLASEAELREEIRFLKERLELLEKKVASQPVQPAQPAQAATSASWSDRITLSGVVEVEAAYADTDNDDESDITLATVELAIDTQVTDWVNVHALALFEEGEENDHLIIDEGIITIGNSDVSPFYIAAGRMYVPFGNFESNMISDPLTLELGETRETAIQLGFESDGFHGSAFTANGDARENGNERIDYFGANLGFGKEAEDGSGFDLGISFVNSIADSDSLQGTVTDADNLDDETPGIGAYATLRRGNFTLIGEYLGATEDFAAADLTFDGSGAEPESWNLEAGYDFKIANKEATFALAWQGTDEALALELPEDRYMAALSVGIYENTTLSFEWAHDDDYDSSDGGTGDDSDTFTAQLAAEF